MYKDKTVCVVVPAYNEEQLIGRVIETMPEFVDKIVDGRMQKFYKENCLLSQVFIKDETKKLTVEDLLKNLIAVIGENIVIRRFTRYEVGA